MSYFDLKNPTVAKVGSEEFRNVDFCVPSKKILKMQNVAAAVELHRCRNVEFLDAIPNLLISPL